MKRSARLYAEDIRASIDLIAEFVEGMDRAAFEADLKTQFAVLRAL